MRSGKQLIPKNSLIISIILFLSLLQTSHQLKGTCSLGLELDSIQIAGELSYRKHVKKMCYGLAQADFEKYFRGIENSELIGSGTYGRVYKLGNRVVGAGGDAGSPLLFSSEKYQGDKFIAVKVMQPSKYEDLFMELNNSKCLESYGDLHKHAFFSIVLVDYCFYNASSRDREYFLTMKYFPYSLKQALDGEISLPTGEAHVQMMMISLGLQLEKMHENGFLHRDIKPENILLDPAGMPHFTDFGVSTTDLELASSLVGSPFYLSPDVVKEKTYGRKGDIFALGLVYHNLLYNSRKSHFKIFSGLDMRSVFDDGNFEQFKPNLAKIIFPENYSFLGVLINPPGELHGVLTEVIRKLVAMHSETTQNLQRVRNAFQADDFADGKQSRMGQVKMKAGFHRGGLNLNRNLLHETSDQKVYLLV